MSKSSRARRAKKSREGNAASAHQSVSNAAQSNLTEQARADASTPPPAPKKPSSVAWVAAVSVLFLGGALFVFTRHAPQAVSAHSGDPQPPPAPAQSAAPQPAQPAPEAVPGGIPKVLADINGKLNPRSFSFLNARRATMLRADLDDPKQEFEPMLRRNLEMTYARELLFAGKSDEALRACRANMRELSTNAPELARDEEFDQLLFEALCNLRRGEQMNCCVKNNQNSCLVPIAGKGFHAVPEGSRGAVENLTECLRRKPDHPAARWLLNIAYMTLGEYPDKVPAQWLIPPAIYGGDYPLKKFPNLAPQMGLDLDGWAGSVVMEDFDDRGLLDLVISSWNIEGQLRYFRNNGDGTFTERTKEAGFSGELGGLNMITTDFNNDGRPDIVVLRGGWFGASGFYPLSLLRNDGNGHFTDVTVEAGLLTFGPTQTAVAFDYNGDGFLDLFVGYEAENGVAAPCKLFRNNGDGTFTDVSAQCGLNISRFVKGVVSADYLHSGRPGLYLSCLDGPNILLRNDGPAGADKSPKAPWKFTDVSAQAGVNLQQSSFSCFFFDYDNDGWPDLYVGGYGGRRSLGEIAKDYFGQPSSAQKAKLYHNNRDGTFSDVSKQAHLDKVNLGMGINFGDLDNDGWLDFYVGTGSPELEMLLPNRMFRNHDGQYFDEVTTTGNFGHLQKGHGIAFGSLDNSGQQDVFLVAGGAYEGDTAHDCLFVNPGNENRWVTLKLTGVKSNRIALGAEICVTVETPQGERRICKTVSTGGSFGDNPLRQEIGLGNATAIKQVTIRWPATGAEQVVKDLKLDRFYKIQEGNSTAEEWHVPAFKLPGRKTRSPALAPAAPRK